MGLVDETPELEETAFYLELARAAAQGFSEDRRAVSTVAEALEAAYALGGIYEDFTLFYGAAIQIAESFDDAELLDRLRRIVDDDGSTPPAGLAGHRALVGALAAVRIDDADEVAEEGFTAAMGHYEAWGSAVHTARARAAYGAWLTRRGRTDEAQPHLEAARRTYASLGAVAWLEEIEESLAASRVGS